MHEVSLMSNTLEIALEYANQQNATKISRLKMRIGEVSGVVPEALEFAFSALTQGTIAQDAQLEIESVPVQCFCPNCQQLFYPPDIIYECPNCHQISSQIQQGKEIQLLSLEIIN